MKKVFLIHGWDGNPENNWFPWLKTNLEEKGFQVINPYMPGEETPVKEVWLKVMRESVTSPDQETYFVGHSLGCQAIQRYLESLEGDVKVGGAVFVAGWINDPKWDGRTKDEEKVVHDWFDKPKDYEKIKSHCDNFVSIFSTDDPFIPKANWKESEDILSAKVIMVPNKSHFDDEAGIKELPEALRALLEMSE